jgi:ribonucleoside-diphosphate reductase alpha chain
MAIEVTKRDGTRVPFDANEINRSIERACRGLENQIGMVTQIATESELSLYDGVTTEELDQATINAALQNVQEDPAYDKAATRLLLKVTYKKVLGRYDSDDDSAVKNLHKAKFPGHIVALADQGLLDRRMAEKFDLEALAAHLDPERDEKLNYAGLSGLLNRYAMKNREQEVVETPQFFFMRVAMGLSYNEEDPTAQAKKFYDLMSTLRYVAGGSTNVGAGTSRPSLSNCFLLQVEDDMAHIAKSVADTMLIAKATGGQGVSITKLRATGSPLKSTSGVSSGPAPFAKIMDTAVRAIQRAGKKVGALCLYMENWHLDFPEFIDWRHNAGDDYQRMRTANTAAFISDEFIKRVKAGQDWYLFDPAETPDLIELYGDAFSRRYNEYAAKADRGEMRMYKKVPARELWRQMLVSLMGTSHPWITYKDPINLRALNDNTGTIHMSNLCTEITLPQDRDNIAVCNLASVNLSAHLDAERREVDWQKLEETVRAVVRHLDNLIDINELPIEEARRSDRENRAVGLGVMGFADAFEKMGWSYDNPHSYDFTDQVFEFVSYMAIDESAKLAEERGSYQNFPGSGWSRGMVPIDSLERLERERGVALSVDRESKHKGLDWNLLREKVKKGMRNATLMAVAPNANIGLIAGTTLGMDARFAQVFSRNKISGKYLDINTNLVADLKKRGLWEQVRGKIIESQGDIGGIEEIPQELRDIYKTSFTTSPYAYIEVAARAQKWVDQGISRNMYLETREIDEVMAIYEAAWEKGLKTTYYLHMKPRHTAEQSTVKVNKAAVLGKTGFGAIRARLAEADKAALPPAPPVESPISPDSLARPATVEVVAAAAPAEAPKYRVHNRAAQAAANGDPMESMVCDSCQ